jgi:hypothetical protein
LKLLALISSAYPMVELTDEQDRLWTEMLSDVPFERAQRNLREHIRSSRFPPTVADIVRHDPNQFVNYERLKEETALRFEQMDEWEQQAVPLPERLQPKLLRGGEGN